jgi:hypothetical protein
MTDAINAKSDVLGERELDAVSGGLLCLPLAAYTVRPASKGEGMSGQNDPAQCRKLPLRRCGRKECRHEKERE